MLEQIRACLEHVSLGVRRGMTYQPVPCRAGQTTWHAATVRVPDGRTTLWKMRSDPPLGGGRKGMRFPAMLAVLPFSLDALLHSGHLNNYVIG